MRKAIEKAVLTVTQGSEDIKVVLAGLSNVYTHYITTFEEYQKQRYEAASTIYGPHTLRAYQTQYKMLTEKLASGGKLKSDVRPPNLKSKQISLNLPVLSDNAPR